MHNVFREYNSLGVFEQSLLCVAQIIKAHITTANEQLYKRKIQSRQNMLNKLVHWPKIAISWFNL